MKNNLTHKMIPKVKFGVEYFNGSHPKIRSQYQSRKRPTEFGNKVWATSFLLMEYLHENPSQFNGLRVLEIGCGWGLVGIYMAKNQNCAVTCSDLDPHVLPIVELHSKANQVEVRCLEAGFADFSSELLSEFDLIIGAEVCYSEEVSKDLFAMMGRAFESGVKKIVIADPGRPDFEENLTPCQSFCNVELKKLAGSVNGKFTHLFTATPK